jgi:ferredoxin
MAMKIVEECINCGACEADCPNEAIEQGDSVYVIKVERCTECVGAYDEPQCVGVCPIDGAIVKDPANVETREALQAKYARLH